jgi:hypothetical protein
MKRPAEDAFESFRVISGGQTGADLAGLKAARAVKIPTGGTAPPGFLTSVGEQPDLLKGFGLVELQGKHNRAGGYVQRSIKNVIDSDATVAFRFHAGAGTDKTIGYCVEKKWTTTNQLDQTADVWVHEKGFRPVIVIAKHDEAAKVALLSFLTRLTPGVLNVAGHREDADNQEWVRSVEIFLVDVFQRLKFAKE